MQLTEEQQIVLDTIIRLREEGAPEIRLAGAAGTGKTTLIRALLDELPFEDIEVVTPTNKAAKVLSRKGVPAATLYAKFFTSSGEKSPKITAEDEQRMLDAGTHTSAQIAAMRKEQRNADRKLVFHPNYELEGLLDGKRAFANTIVVDEASMLQFWILRHLKRMCNTLILVGDPHQLPPVNDRLMPDGYFVTREPNVKLTTVLRQSSGSPILELATCIRNGRFPDPLVRALAPSVDFRRWVHPNRKIIAFTNNHRRETNRFVRQLLGYEGTLPKPGELLVCNSNVDSELLNGTEVKVVSFKWPYSPDGMDIPLTASLAYEDEDGKPGFTLVNIGRFLEDLDKEAIPPQHREHLAQIAAVSIDTGEGASFSYGYCITAHKAQGSEWDEVCVIDERFVLNKVDPSGQNARRWLYTAITRAAKSLVFADYRWIRSNGASKRAAA